MNRIYVVRHDDSWASRKAGAERVSRVFPTQKDAYDYARKQAIAEKAELYIQGVNGKFRGSNSYGNDPRAIHG